MQKCPGCSFTLRVVAKNPSIWSMPQVRNRWEVPMGISVRASSPTCFGNLGLEHSQKTSVCWSANWSEQHLCSTYLTGILWEENEIEDVKMLCQCSEFYTKGSYSRYSQSPSSSVKKQINKPAKPFRAAPFNTVATRHTGYRAFKMWLVQPRNWLLNFT